MLRPGESKPLNKPLSPDTKFIGVMAAFRELERARAVDGGAVAKLCMDKREIPRRVRDARIAAVARGLI